MCGSSPSPAPAPVAAPAVVPGPTPAPEVVAKPGGGTVSRQAGGSTGSGLGDTSAATTAKKSLLGE